MKASTLVEIERKAADLLERHRQQTPPVDVLKLCTDMKIDLVQEDLDDEVSGVLIMQRRPIIAVNRHHARSRQRFTIAHEIGHFVLHSTNKDQVFIDRAAIQFRNHMSSSGLDPNEVAANNFAAALLMPKGMLEEDLRSVDEALAEVHVIRLAKKYGVSEQAMNIRLARLDFVSFI
jgi:Zn-dependent peptidase ImmA (M78 family)